MSSKSSMAPATNSLAGIGLMLFGVFMFASNDALGKFLIATFSIGQILLIRSAAALVMLTPFIWRRSLDYAAVLDIQAIKRQIHVHKTGEGLDAAGANLKLGRGGIREIEFYAQTQQLILGGRDPELREVRPDFSSADARGVDLSNARFGQAYVVQADFTDAVLCGAVTYAVGYTTELYFKQDGQMSKQALKAAFKEQYRQARQKMTESGNPPA